MKRRIFCCLTAALAISLAACGSGNGSSAGTDEADMDAPATKPSEDMELDSGFSVDTEESEDPGNSEESEDPGNSEDSKDSEDLESSETLEEDGNADASVTVEGQLLTTPYFTVELPEDWKDLVSWSAYQHTYENEQDYSLGFAAKECAEAGEGGNICSIQVSTAPPQFIRYVGGEFVCGLKKTGEQKVSAYIGVSYPTDVQFGEKTKDLYDKLYAEAQKIKDSIAPASGYEKVEMTYAEALSDVETTDTGVILDAAMHTFTMQTMGGDIITFGVDDMSAASKDEILLGHCYEITYTGLIENDGDTSGASLVSLKNIDNTVAEKNFDAMYAASQVVLAFHMKSSDYLAGLCRFPMTLDGKKISSQEELASMDFDDAFTADLQRNIRYCDLVDAEISGDRFSISLIGQAPEVVIEKNKDADTWSVTAINNQ
ncbi:MAG: hypothetical protein SOS94_01675 [Lachnospiraceae bacterium]|nr:hypothetical protein [Lachnospiraceae bacterium]